MKSLVKTTNGAGMGASGAGRMKVNGAGSSATADRCAGLLLDTLPPLMNAMRGMIHDTPASDLTVHQFRTLLFIQRHDGARLSDRKSVV